VDLSTDGVNAVLKKVNSARLPDFDYENRLKSLLEHLGEKREDVILYMERLRNMESELYERMRANR
jgi:hypothetical protein